MKITGNAAEAPTTEMAAVEAPTAVHAAVDVVGAGDACSACGVHLAADQRYCVECGQPRAAAKVPSLLAEADAAAIVTAPPAAARMPANTALIAGVGTLLLAMGIGVFIGSQAVPRDSGSSRFPPQVTVVSSGGPGAAGGTAAPAATAAAAAATPTPAKGKATATTAPKKATAKQTASPAAATKPPPNAVHVGSPGSGPGYQNGKFTGNFFGSG